MADIALLGFGTVGSGVAEALTKNRSLIASNSGPEINIKYILDLRDFPDHPLGDRVVHDFNIILNDPDVKVVCELMGGLHPAYDFTAEAIKAGKSVVTSNKAVVAAYGVELLKLARRHGVRYLFEASVGGGIPIIRPMLESLAGNEVYEIDGILNGTTNYILTEMKEKGKSFDEALKEAQALGYAEADPTADVGGFDSCRKICILAAIAFGKLVPSEIVKTVGITEITREDVKRAEENGCTVKLIARAVKQDDGIFLTVAPYAVRKSNPLSTIDDVFNGILVRGNTSGDLMFYGRGAGKLPTASAVVSDIIDLLKYDDIQPVQQLWKSCPEDYADSLDEESERESEEFLGYPILK